ncbi:MAG: CPBP family intramembrane glutamic endopeptidase [Acidobacteriota bacterium]
MSQDQPSSPSNPSRREWEDLLPGVLLWRRAPRLHLTLEALILFVVVPVALYFGRQEFATMIIPTLLVMGLGCGLALALDPRFDRRRLWNARDFGRRLAATLKVFVPLAILTTLVTALWMPQRFLAFPASNPTLWLFVMVAYPVVSVYPQELIFRSFFFHRYRAILPTSRLQILASGLAFGLAHLFFGNWIAPLLTTAGGVLFARTYARTDSTLQASIEHALWGDLLFTVGLGWYFYGGSIS